MTKRHVEITLTGVPFIDARGRCHGWRRTNPVLVGGRPRLITDKKERFYRTAVAARVWEAWHAAGHRGPLIGPVSMTVQARFRRPKTGRKGELFAEVKPDADNIAKSVLDALSKDAQGRERPRGHEGPWGLIGDDKQVCALAVGKWWAPQGEDGSITIMVREIE